MLLAENEEGYANLTKIVSKGFVEGYYYKPRVDKEPVSYTHLDVYKRQVELTVGRLMKRQSMRHFSRMLKAEKQ